MRLSALGTLGGWATFAAIYVVWPDSILSKLSLLVAASFTLLLLAHLIVLTVRVAKLHDAVHAGHSANVAAEFSVGRRAVLLRFGRAALWAAVAGLGLLRMPREAESGPTATCERPADRDTKGMAGSNLGSKDVCAKNPHVAEETARPLFQAAATAFANSVCTPFSTTTCPFCRASTEMVEIKCHEITGTCPAGTKRFSCEGIVTKVACRCATT